MAYGTLTIDDLQATELNTVVADLDSDMTFAAIGNTLAAHNVIVEGMFADFAEPTTDRLRRYGATDSMEMEEGDELSIPHPQKVTAGVNVGFPLRLYHAGLQWSEMWFKRHTVAELAGQVNALMDADARWIIYELKRALFLASNFTHNDRFVDQIDLAVKRLANADSAPLPVGPNGEEFDGSTHTHYLARAGGALASTDVDALLTTIKEHYAQGDIRLYINQAQEAAIRGYSDFVPYVDARITTATDVDRATGRALDPIQIYNRAIGLYNGVEVWVKPWVPASYMFAWNAMAPKPVVYRWDPAFGRDLHLIYGFPGQITSTPGDYPLHARGYRRIFGFGAWNRVNGAVLYTANTTYAAPTLAA